MSPNSLAHAENTGKGSLLARGMFPIRKCGLGPGGRFSMAGLVTESVYRDQPGIDLQRRLPSHCAVACSNQRWLVTAALCWVSIVPSIVPSMAPRLFAETGGDAWLRYSSPEFTAAKAP